MVKWYVFQAKATFRETQMPVGIDTAPVYLCDMRGFWYNRSDDFAIAGREVLLRRIGDELLT